MYCIECGKQIPDHSRFCSFCGSKVANQGLGDSQRDAGNVLIDHKKLEEDVRKGTLIYLRDIVSLEFGINKLQNELNAARNPIIIHDYWFYWKCYYLKNPINTRDFLYEKLILSYSHSLDTYYYAFGRRNEQITFYDYNGNYANHEFGKPSCGFGSKVLDKKTKDQLCTLPIVKKKMFSGPIVVNWDSTWWYQVVQYNNYKLDGLLDGFAEVKSCIEQFEKSVVQQETDYQKQLPIYREKIKNIEAELDSAKKLLNDLYGLNIIPTKFRNIGCAYFIFDFFSSSNTPLSQVFLHLDLNTIQSQLNQVINNQRDSILQQAIIISQNEEIIEQNRQLFDELSSMNRTVNSNLGHMNATLNSINESCIETSQWAKIAALNAETCAWFEFANYLK